MHPITTVHYLALSAALLLIGTVILVGALTFLPALALGPIVEHFQMLNGHLN